MKLRRGRESNAPSRICSPMPDHSATSPRETALAVTRRKGTEVEAEVALIEREGSAVVIRLDDGEALVFDAQEFDAA